MLGRVHSHISENSLAIPDWVLRILACPWCKSAVEITADHQISCQRCGAQFPKGPVGQPDLRLTRPLRVSLPIFYDPLVTEIPERLWQLPWDVEQKLNHAAQLDAGRPQVDLIAWLLASLKPGDVVLDLGSKSNRDQRLIEGLGAKYLAVEISAPDAMVLGDAHAIPLLDLSVDVVISMSIFEHLKNPFLAAQEIKRVLKPSGLLIGIVGFLESVHGLPHGSFFHHSYLGIYTVLAASGFQVEYLNPGWLAIRAIGFAMLPGLPKRITLGMLRPLETLNGLLYRLYGHRLGNKAKAQAQNRRILSASFHFVARNGPL